MTKAALVPNDSLSVQLKHKIYVPVFMQLRVRARGPMVMMLVGGAIVEMTTVTAHKIGFPLILKSDEAGPGDVVTLTINQKDLDLLPNQAKKLGGALLRKADAADDWQLANNRRAIQ